MAKSCYGCKYFKPQLYGNSICKHPQFLKLNDIESKFASNAFPKCNNFSPTLFSRIKTWFETIQYRKHKKEFEKWKRENPHKVI